MTIQTEHIKRIQEITFAAFKASGRLATLPEPCKADRLAKELEDAAYQLERGAVELRA